MYRQYVGGDPARDKNTNPMNPTTKPITMREFFSLPEVVRLQEIQKANPSDSAAHREATESILAIARNHGASEYFL
jgi:hypothetical protein